MTDLTESRWLVQTGRLRQAHHSRASLPNGIFLLSKDGGPRYRSGFVRTC